MERDYKFTIGENLKKEVIDLIINIYRANSREDKRATIAVARENAQVVRLLLRILQDLKQLKLETFVDLNEKIESISKQLAMWENSQKKKETFPSGESRVGVGAQNLVSLQFPESAG